MWDMAGFTARASCVDTQGPGVEKKGLKIYWESEATDRCRLSSTENPHDVHFSSLLHKIYFKFVD